MRLIGRSIIGTRNLEYKHTLEIVWWNETVTKNKRRRLENTSFSGHPRAVGRKREATWMLDSRRQRYQVGQRVKMKYPGKRTELQKQNVSEKRIKSTPFCLRIVDFGKNFGIFCSIFFIFSQIFHTFCGFFHIYRRDQHARSW